MKPWKPPLKTNVDFYLKLADGMDLVYLSKLKKISMDHKTYDEQRDTISQNQLLNCKEMWTLLADNKRRKLFLNLRPLYHS